MRPRDIFFEKTSREILRPSRFRVADRGRKLVAKWSQTGLVANGEEFEGVLHPVFQEDELTLILVGAFLGLVAGFGQAAFF